LADLRANQGVPTMIDAEEIGAGGLVSGARSKGSVFGVAGAAGWSDAWGIRGLVGVGAERRVHVRRWLAQLSAWLSMGLLVTACAILQTQGLQQAVGDLSQTEVLARWGQPHGIIAGAEGQTLWMYTVRAHIWSQPAGILITSPGWVVPGGWRCTQYLFGFDRTQVLRDWTARRC
jgi:hypothetical protein